MPGRARTRARGRGRRNRGAAAAKLVQRRRMQQRMRVRRMREKRGRDQRDVDEEAVRDMFAAANIQIVQRLLLAYHGQDAISIALEVAQYLHVVQGMSLDADEAEIDAELECHPGLFPESTSKAKRAGRALRAVRHLLFFRVEYKHRQRRAARKTLTGHTVGEGLALLGVESSVTEMHWEHLFRSYASDPEWWSVGRCVRFHFPEGVENTCGIAAFRFGEEEDVMSSVSGARGADGPEEACRAVVLRGRCGIGGLAPLHTGYPVSVWFSIDGRRYESVEGFVSSNGGWAKVDPSDVDAAVAAAMEANPDCRRMLLSTGTRCIVQTGVGHKWGALLIPSSDSSPGSVLHKEGTVWVSSQLQGRNLYGEALMRYRRERSLPANEVLALATTPNIDYASPFAAAKPDRPREGWFSAAEGRHRNSATRDSISSLVRRGSMALAAAGPLPSYPLRAVVRRLVSGAAAKQCQRLTCKVPLFPRPESAEQALGVDLNGVEVVKVHEGGVAWNSGLRTTLKRTDGKGREKEFTRQWRVCDVNHRRVLSTISADLELGLAQGATAEIDIVPTGGAQQDIDHLSVEPLISYLFQRKQKRRGWFSGILYILYVLSFVGAIFWQRLPDDDFVVNSMTQYHLTEFNTNEASTRTIHHVRTVNELYDWLDTAWAGLWAEFADGKRINISAESELYVNEQNKFANTPFLMQMRREKVQCGGGLAVTRKCRSNSGAADQPYGPGDMWKANRVGWMLRGMPNYAQFFKVNDGMYHEFADNETYGYSVHNADSIESVRASLRWLRKNRWIDEYTAFVQTYVVIYNAPLQVLGTCKVVFTVGETGMVTPMAAFDGQLGRTHYGTRLQSRRLCVYCDGGDLVRVLLELIFTLRTWQNAVLEWRKLVQIHRQTGSYRSYLNDGWTRLDLLTLVLSLASISLKIVMYATANSSKPVYLLDNIDNPAIQMEEGVQFAINSTLLILFTVRLFRFVNWDPRLAFFTKTFERTGTELPYFLLVLGLVCGGYGVAGHYFFGRGVERFHLVSGSFSSTLEATFGDLGYREVFQSAPTDSTLGAFANVYYWSFVIIIIFVMTNMFLALVIGSFDKCKKEADVIRRQNAREGLLASDPWAVKWLVNFRHLVQGIMQDGVHRRCVTEPRKRLQLALQHLPIVPHRAVRAFVLAAVRRFPFIRIKDVAHIVDFAIRCRVPVKDSPGWDFPCWDDDPCGGAAKEALGELVVREFPLSEHITFAAEPGSIQVQVRPNRRWSSIMSGKGASLRRREMEREYNVKKPWWYTLWPSKVQPVDPASPVGRRRANPNRYIYLQVPSPHSTVCIAAEDGCVPVSVWSDGHDVYHSDGGVHMDPNDYPLPGDEVKWENLAEVTLSSTTEAEPVGGGWFAASGDVAKSFTATSLANDSTYTLTMETATLLRWSNGDVWRRPADNTTKDIDAADWTTMSGAVYSIQRIAADRWRTALVQAADGSEYLEPLEIERGERVRCFWEVIGRGRTFRIRYAAVCPHCLQAQDKYLPHVPQHRRTPRCSANPFVRHRRPLVAADGAWTGFTRITLRHPRIQCKESEHQQKGEPGTLRVRYLGPFQKYFTQGSREGFSFQRGNIAIAMPKEVESAPYVCCRTRVPLEGVELRLQELQAEGEMKMYLPSPFAVEGLRPLFFTAMCTAAAPPLHERDIAQSLTTLQRRALTVFLSEARLGDVKRVRRSSVAPDAFTGGLPVSPGCPGPPALPDRRSSSSFGNSEPGDAAEEAVEG